MKIHKIIVDQIVQALIFVFDEGYYADKVIEKIFKKHPKWGSRDRKFFAESVYEIVRNRRLYEELVTKVFQKKTETQNELYQRVFWLHWGRHHSLAEFADSVVLESEKKYLTPENIEREIQKISRPEVIESYPDWLYEMGQSELQQNWLLWARFLNQQAPVHLRVNFIKTNPQKLIKDLQSEKVLVKIFDERTPWVLELIQRQNVFSTKAFKEGLFEVQDASSQLVAPLLKLEPGMRCIDACAGAGGKSLHMATIMKNKGKIISMDLHAHKLDELQKRARRNGVQIIETRIIESSKTIKRLTESADRVLLDVPCSGTGVLRRNPDGKWKLTLEEVRRLNQVQREILFNYSRMTRKGGILVYSTCSILPSENQRQVQWFLDQSVQEWELLEEIVIRPPAVFDESSFFQKKDGGIYKSSDGFYAAALVRKN